MLDVELIRREFERDGVVLVRGLFDGSFVSELAQDFDRIIDQLRSSGEDVNARWDSAVSHADGAGTEILHTHQVHRYSALWVRALTDPNFVAAATAILGPDVVLHHTKLFLKPPETGSPFPLHQDWRYFPTEHDSMIAAVIHVSDATEDMGCVRTVPGSHHIGPQASTSGRTVWDDPDEFAAFTREHPIEDATLHPARAGDVLFFHSFTVHGSGPNRSQRPRKTVLAQLFSGADRLDPISDHPVDGLVLAGRNHHASRQSVTKASASEYSASGSQD